MSALVGALREKPLVFPANKDATAFYPMSFGRLERRPDSWLKLATVVNLRATSARPSCR